jgi:lipopolysaccharide transport system ATP-binding protein
MSDLAIRVENLGKQYRIGAKQERYNRFTEQVMDSITAPIRRAKQAIQRSNVETSSRSSDTIWALKDVSFEVQRGEVVGIIGRNGAGKSTLLKILSRITEPTTGRVDLHGRVSSLLEVGTGFHPELTGRENVYLNGAILGMRREEIEHKFDEIVEFSGVEQFLDTPVKRYSSGMQVRLAFAVAAHLEPEIMLVDEVLAVGDAEFQRRCLGKMKDVAQGGRTVLFVSHNMGAVTALCQRAIMLKEGHVEADGGAEEVVSQYMSGPSQASSEAVWPDACAAPGDALVRLRAVRVLDSNRAPRSEFLTNQPIRVVLEFDLARLDPALCIGFDLTSPHGIVARSYHNDGYEKDWPPLREGHNCLECELPAGLLNAGTYGISPRISLHNLRWIVHVDDVVTFGAILGHGVSPFWNTLSAGKRPGVAAPILPWHSEAGRN